MFKNERIELNKITRNYLITYSPKDKPWDVHKTQSDRVADLYSQTIYDRYQGRIGACSGYLGFRWLNDEATGESRLKLFQASFCRCRHCPICQWRRCLLWLARFYQALPAIEAQYPSCRWVFLTLTVKNCPLLELRPTLQGMNKGWQRLTHLREWPALGFVRSTEVTAARDGSAHPHFHTLMMVKPSYFGKSYLTQKRWVELWQQSMRLDYAPMVDVRAVKNNDVRQIAPEVLKYAIKPEDMMQSSQWLEELTRQLCKLRFLATGGFLKDVLKEGDETNEELVKLVAELQDDENLPALHFNWDRPIQHYRKVSDR